MQTPPPEDVDVVVHPIWDWDTGVGWIISRPTPLRLRHLAHQPAVSLSYWSPAQDVAYLDCQATWVPDESKVAVWERCTAEDPPMGFDPDPMFPDGVASQGFAPIELRPDRIRVALAADAASGEAAYLWTREDHPKGSVTPHGLRRLTRG